MRQILIIFLVFNSAFHCYSQDTISSSLKLIHGKDTIYVNDFRYKYIRIKIISESDSAKEIIGVYEALLQKDTIFVRPRSYEYFSYKNNTSKNPKIYYSSKTTERIKIPINNVYYVKKSRDKLKFFAGLIGSCAAISAVIVAPLASIDKHFNTNRYYSIQNSSFAILATSLTVGLVWGDKHYYTQKHKRKKIWKIE